jgi:hypothetical protein
MCIKINFIKEENLDRREKRRRKRNDDEVKDNGNKNKFKLTEKNNRETSAKYLYDYYGNLSGKRLLLLIRNENHM